MGTTSFLRRWRAIHAADQPQPTSVPDGNAGGSTVTGKMVLVR